MLGTGRAVGDADDAGDPAALPLCDSKNPAVTPPAMTSADTATATTTVTNMRPRATTTQTLENGKGCRTEAEEFCYDAAAARLRGSP